MLAFYVILITGLAAITVAFVVLRSGVAGVTGMVLVAAALLVPYKVEHETLNQNEDCKWIANDYNTAVMCGEHVEKIDEPYIMKHIGDTSKVEVRIKKEISLTSDPSGTYLKIRKKE